ncbi:baculoviral IAP repeat-containing protein 5 isoform X1 [Orussus abietinus]|uniref:baculoviral IAP repeat-containing protein 5 isoform X1 n=1 Tax=Orussus abietinus TaxID=222816 RepID=UPI000626807C|nr:baculoviral IAP repeat-containing protein 5 isoform X1 [Orussus abietinus]
MSDSEINAILNVFCSQIENTFWKGGRLETYDHWPFKSSTNGCNPELMASAGFVAIGGEEEPDLVECFICLKQLDGWEANDNPWFEHHKHMPTCPFIALNKQNELTWTIEDFLHLLRDYYANRLARDMNQMLQKVKEKTCSLSKEIPKLYKNLPVET